MTDRATELAARMLECPECRGKGYIQSDDSRGVASKYDLCPRCKGTGKVPMFEGVRQDCCECEDRGWFEGAFGKYDCNTCDGRGWVPSKDFGQWVQAIRSLEDFSTITVYKDEIRICLLRGEKGDRWLLCKSGKGTDLDALLEALEEVIREP